MIQLSTGMLSYAAIPALQLGQAERGKITDNPSGMR
jgi:hypothetical protein